MDVPGRGALRNRSVGKRSGSQFAALVLAPRHRMVHERRMEQLLRDGKQRAIGQSFELEHARADDGHEISIEMTVWIVLGSRQPHVQRIRSRYSRGGARWKDTLREGARLRTVVDGVRDVIILTDIAGIVVYASPSTRERARISAASSTAICSMITCTSEGPPGVRSHIATHDRHRAQKIADAAADPDTRWSRIWMEATTAVVRDDRVERSDRPRGRGSATSPTARTRKPPPGGTGGRVDANEQRAARRGDA